MGGFEDGIQIQIRFILQTNSVLLIFLKKKKK